MKIKRFFSLVITTAMAITALTSAISVPVVNATNEYATSGTWGNDGTWVLSQDGTLTVTGTGQLESNALNSELKFVNDVNRLVFGEGITSISNSFMGNGQVQSANVAEIVLPSTLSGEFSFYLRGSTIKNVYIYSKNINIPKNNSGILPYPNSGTVIHLYRDSDTEKCFRSLYDYTDEDIVYIEKDRLEESEPVPANVPELTEISGPAGLTTKWEWSEANKTLTFSGKGKITIDQDYKEYSSRTENVNIKSGITDISTTSDKIQTMGGTSFGAFSNFTNLKDLELPETLKRITGASFYNDTSLKTVDLPSTLEQIGDCAFQNTNIERITFPKSLLQIGESSFENTNIKSINLHENMTIGGSAFKDCSLLTEVTIPKNVTFSLTRIGGQGMARENAAFSGCIKLEKVILADGSSYPVTDTWGHLKGNGIAESLCSNCTSLKTVIIKDKNIVYIANDTFDTTSNPTFYIYKDSTTETTLKNAGYLTNSNTVYLATKDDIDKLDNAIKSFDDNADTSKYTEDYAKDFNDALEKGKDILNKYNLDNYSGITLNEVNDVLNVLNNIEYKPADYTAVDAAIEKIPSDLSKYTEESVKKLQDALDAVNRNLYINSQETVDNYAKAIEDAIKGLVQKTPATTPTDPTKSPSVHPTANVPIVTAPKTRSASEVAKDKAAAEKIVKQAKITKLKVKSKAKKKITVTWKKVKKAVGYEVQVSKKKNFKKNIFDKFTSKKKITFKKKLKSGKTYYVRVRAYATYKDKNGVECKVYSKWNKKLRKVKVK